jgi:hypothetical protein
VRDLFPTVNSPDFFCRKLENILTSVRLASRRTWVERWQHRDNDKDEIERLTMEMTKFSEDFKVNQFLIPRWTCTQYCPRLR